MTILGAFGGWFAFEPVLQWDSRGKHACYGPLAKPGYSLREDGHDIDALSGVELMGLQSDAFEALLQLSLGSGESYWD